MQPFGPPLRICPERRYTAVSTSFDISFVFPVIAIRGERPESRMLGLTFTRKTSVVFQPVAPRSNRRTFRLFSPIRRTRNLPGSPPRCRVRPVSLSRTPNGTPSHEMAPGQLTSTGFWSDGGTRKITSSSLYSQMLRCFLPQVMKEDLLAPLSPKKGFHAQPNTMDGAPTIVRAWHCLS